MLALYADCESLRNLPGYTPVEAGERAEWLMRMIDRGFNFVAEEEGRLVGHLALVRVGDTAQMSVFVHPDSRRRGIGSTLLRVAIFQARDMGLRHVWIAITPDDLAVQEVLLQVGFSISARTESRTELVLSL